MLRRRSPQGATLAPDGSARPDCKGCCIRRGGNYRTLHTENGTERGDGALPVPKGRGLHADREGQFGAPQHRWLSPHDAHTRPAQRPHFPHTSTACTPPLSLPNDPLSDSQAACHWRGVPTSPCGLSTVSPPGSYCRRGGEILLTYCAVLRWCAIRKDGTLRTHQQVIRFSSGWLGVTAPRQPASF